jgi:hypothetical protein
MVVPFKLAPVAVNVTLLPKQIVVDGEAAIETVGVVFGLTTIVPVALTLPHPPVKGIE